MTDPITIRVVLIGDSQVGKTSLIHKFVRNSFEKQQKSTVGAVFHTYEQDIQGQKVIMQIWDTAGQEKYRSLGPIYYRNASAGIAVFDITNQDSLKGLQQWIEEFKKNTEEPLVYIVGNKIDLENENSIKRTDVENFALKNNAIPFFTSAKNDLNVAELFKSVFDELITKGKFSHVIQSRVNSKKVDIENNNSCC